MGRFGEPALWILVALRQGPSRAGPLLDTVRALDGPIGSGTLIGALARLEHRGIVKRMSESGRPMYRLASQDTKEAR